MNAVIEPQSEGDSRRHIVVVGGGIVGTCCAWYLQKSGCRVTLIEKETIGSQCSHGNCGYISPSHVMPLPGPGQLRNGLKGLFSTRHALRIRPQWSPSFWWWMLRFAARCNQRDAVHSGHALNALLRSSAELYRELISEEKLDVDWNTSGLMFVFRDQAMFDHFADTNALTDREFGVSGLPLNGDELTAREPALRDGLAGAYLFECDAHLKPDRLMSELHRVLADRGVDLREHTSLQSLKASDGTVTEIVTSAGDRIRCDGTVIATGAVTPLLADVIGIRLPILPGKGYSITMTRPKVCPQYPLILEECHVAITPFADGYRIGSTMEFAGYDTTLNPARLAFLREGAADYLKDPFGEQVTEEWYGWRPMTSDGLPYIDRAPDYSNLWLCTGHNMLGLTLGPVSGRLIAELITDQDPHIEAAHLRQLAAER